MTAAVRARLMPLLDAVRADLGPQRAAAAERDAQTEVVKDYILVGLPRTLPDPELLSASLNSLIAYAVAVHAHAIRRDRMFDIITLLAAQQHPGELPPRSTQSVMLTCGEHTCCFAMETLHAHVFPDGLAQKQREIERLAKKERREARHRDALTAAEATPAVPRSGSGARTHFLPVLALTSYGACGTLAGG